MTSSIMLRHPQPKGGGASSALQKASALLKGGGGRPGGTGLATRQPQSSANSDENDITSYLAGLAQRTSGQANGRATHNSSTEGVRQTAEPGSAGSKFLKKKTAIAVSEAHAQDKDVGHLQNRAPSISAQQAAPRTVSSAGQDLQRRETGIADSASNLSLSRDSDGFGSGTGTVLPATATSQRSPGAGGSAQRFLKQSHAQLPASQPGATPVPARGQSTSLPMRSTGPRGLTAQRSGLDTSDEGMTTLMEGLTTTSNSARTSEEFRPDGPPSHVMRPAALSTDRGLQKGSRAPQPLHVELPTAADTAARRPATAPVATTPSVAFRAPSARLNASAGRAVSSSPEPESIADDEDDISDRRGIAESPRPSEMMLSARSSSAPSETTTPRAVHRVRLLDMDDLAAAASEVDSEPPAFASFVTAPRGRLSHHNGGDPTATAIILSSRPVPLAPSTGVRQSGADSPTTEEIASSVSTSSSDESVVRPAVAGKPKPRPDSASSRKSERQTWQQRQPQQRSEAAAETYSEDFDDSAASELHSANARSSGSSASVRSGSRGRMAAVQQRQQQSRYRRHSSSSADCSSASRHSRRNASAVPMRRDRRRKGSNEGSDRRGGRRGGSRATNSTGSDGQDDGTHVRSRTYSYGSETWHTATPSPRRPEPHERRQHARKSRMRSHSLSSLSSQTSSDAEELSRRSRHRAFEKSARQRPSRDASPSSSRSQPHRRQRQPYAATNITTAKADVCLQTGLDLEEAILRCHWNSPRAAFAQFRLTTSASAAAASECPPSSTLLQINGLGLPSAAALSDLLARQVALTRDFIETQKRLHQCLLTNLEGSDYRYTTLEDTKQYIIAHRKPKLTFDEAVRLVKEDMNVQ